MSIPVFALDLGNKQTKLMSQNSEYILPSHFLKKENLGISMGLNSNTLLTTFKSPMDDQEYVWSKEIDSLHLDNYMIDTLIRHNRYSNKSFKLLANFAMGLLATDFEETQGNKIMEINVVAGMPSKDFKDQQKVKDLTDALLGQHQVDINESIYTVKVIDVYVVPQPIGTLYNELLADDGKTIVDNELRTDKVGIVDIGGGTILIDTLVNFNLLDNDSKQINTGINDLYRTIAGQINGDVSLFKMAEALRAPEKIYEFSKNTKINITELVDEKIDDFTHQLLNQISSTLDDLDSIDRMIITGGGANLVNQEMMTQELPNIIFTKNSEMANVEGFYKLGVNVY